MKNVIILGISQEVTVNPFQIKGFLINEPICGSEHKYFLWIHNYQSFNSTTYNYQDFHEEYRLQSLKLIDINDIFTNLVSISNKYQDYNIHYYYFDIEANLKKYNQILSKIYRENVMISLCQVKNGGIKVFAKISYQLYKFENFYKALTSTNGEQSSTKVSVKFDSSAIEQLSKVYAFIWVYKNWYYVRYPTTLIKINDSIKYLYNTLSGEQKQYLKEYSSLDLDQVYQLQMQDSLQVDDNISCILTKFYRNEYFKLYYKMQVNQGSNSAKLFSGKENSEMIYSAQHGSLKYKFSRKFIFNLYNTSVIKDYIGNYYLLCHELVSGRHGRVKATFNLQDNSWGAVRIVKYDSETSKQEVYNEIHLIYRYYQSQKRKITILDRHINGSVYKNYQFMDGASDSLHDYIRKYADKCNLSWILKIVKYISFELKKIHELHILHLNLKLTNILIFHNDQIKITNFRLAVDCESNLQVKMLGLTDVRRPDHIAPEIFIENSLDCKKEVLASDKSDIYSLGKVINDIFVLLKTPMPSQLQRLVTVMTKCLPEDRGNLDNIIHELSNTNSKRSMLISL